MDAALLLVAGNESCPQPQTSEHLAAIEIMKLEHILILQNKIDLVKESQAREQSEQIARFVKGAFSSSYIIMEFEVLKLTGHMFLLPLLFFSFDTLFHIFNSVNVYNMVQNEV